MNPAPATSHYSHASTTKKREKLMSKQTGFKAAHSFDPLTGEYVGATLAQLSPLENGVYLLPANATFNEPQAPVADKWPCWTGSAWELRVIPA